jgi:hypothetical protein
MTATLFPPGHLVATPGALDAFARNQAGPGPVQLLVRHLSGDWGDLCAEDARANQHALRYGLRLLSAYPLADGTRVWVITEADRSITTLLLPSEY